MVQHFTADLLLNAVAIELMPDLMSSSRIFAIVVRFALDGGTMLTIAKLTKPAEISGRAKNGMAAS